ncbi:MAG: CYTH domain-containing protein [Microbacterium arborescens]
MPGVASVGDAEPRELDARYLDTPDGRLAAALTALRRRTGGPDEGWHIKRSTPEGKLETQWPLGDDVDGETVVVPDAVRAALSEIADGPFDVIARIRNSRTAYALRDTAGGPRRGVRRRPGARDRRPGRSRDVLAGSGSSSSGPRLRPTPPASSSSSARRTSSCVRPGERRPRRGSKLGRALGC